jgi:hypothetical protein
MEKKMRKLSTALVSGLVLTAMSATATARDEDMTGLTCDDIVYNYTATAQRSDVTGADIDAACRDVVELDGQKFAKIKAELTNVRGNNATFHFILPDGTRSDRHQVTVAPEWRAEIQGRSYRMRDLTRGQELNIYVPADRFEVHVASTESEFVAYTPVAMSAADDSSSSAMLPATAGALPLFGLFGGLALFGASLIRVFRRS